MKKHIPFILILICLSLFAVKTLKGPDFFDGHDNQAHITRLYQYDLSLKDGQFPPRWAGGLLAGRGYPVFIFAYPLPYAVAETFHYLGLNLAQSLKLVYALSYLSSAVFMYLFAYRYWQSRWSGLLSALLWSWAPPIFEKIFIAGALGAVTSFTFIPLTFLCLYNLFYKPNLKNSLYLALSTALWSLSHLLTPIIFSPLLIIFLLSQIKRLKNPHLVIKYLVITGFFTLGLIAWFIIPALAEIQFTHFNDFIQHQYQSQFVSLKRLLYSKWGTHAPGWGNNPVSQQVGVAQWLAVGLAGLYWFKSTKSLTKTLVFPFLLSFIISIFLMLKISSPIWQFLTPLQNVHTPWRFLSLAVFTAAICGGYLVKVIKKTGWLLAIFVLLIFLIFYGNRNHLRINAVQTYSKDFFQTYTGVATATNEHLPIWINQMPTDFPQEKLAIIDGNCSTTTIVNKSNLQSFKADCQQPSTLQLNTAYYPGWQVMINNQNIITQVKKNLAQSNGMIRFSIDSGSHQITVRFQDTPLRLITKYLSILSLFSAIFILFFHRFKSS